MKISQYKQWKFRFPILGILCCLIFGFSGTDHHYQINGQLVAPDKTILYLSYQFNGRQILDSSILTSNKFAFSGVFPETVICTLSNSANPQMRIFLAKNESITLFGDLGKFHQILVNGVEENSIYEAFKTNASKISADYRRKIKVSGGDLKNRLGEEYIAFHTRLDSLILANVKVNRDLAVSSIILIDNYVTNPDIAKAENAYRLLSERGNENIYAKRIKQFISTATIIRPGKPAPIFELSNNSTGVFKLTDHRGKYLLLDFWASWCPPCRAEHPMLRKLYSKMDTSRISFVSVSMDSNEAAWKQAVKIDQLSWLQINDPKALNGSIADLYGIKSLPFNCIIDPLGNITAVKLRGEDLVKFIEGLNVGN